MKFVNRCVVTLKPRQAFIDWASRMAGQDIPEDWAFEGGAYLLDEQDSEDAIVANIERFASKILENELSVWVEDEGLWPAERDMTLLKSLFYLHISVAGFDLGSHPLMRAELPEMS